MRTAFAFVSLLFMAVTARAADPVFLDQLIETPQATLQSQFPGLKKEGCYSIGANRFLLITMDKKDAKPWRVAVASAAPCRRVEEVPAVDVRERTGVDLGDSTVTVIEKMGRPDASAPPDATMRRLGDLEYFYICRVSDGCARHTSIFMREGVVTAVAEWYSE